MLILGAAKNGFLNTYINEKFMPDEQQRSYSMSHICSHSDLTLNIYKGKRERNSNWMHSLHGYYIQLGKVSEALEKKLVTIIPSSACQCI